MDIDRGDIDPRLREPAQAAAPYSILPPPSTYPLNPIRLPPPQQQQLQQQQQQQQQQSQQPQHHNPLPSWSQEAPLPYYALRPESQHALPPPDIHAHNNLFSTSHPQDGGPVELKRPRACEACRGLKVKCDPDPIKGTCRRCAKAGRTCIVTAPSRKRQKKTDSRVAELEKKINGLEAILQRKDRPTSESEDGGMYDDEHPTRVSSINQHKIRPERTRSMLDQGVETAGNPLVRAQCRGGNELVEGKKLEFGKSPQVINGLKRRRSEYQDEDTTSDCRRLSVRNEATANRPSKTSSDATNLNLPFTAEASKSGASSSIVADSTAPSNEYEDVIDRKILDTTTAENIFSYYINHMATHMPIVVLPSNVKIGMIRKNKPTLFLAILSVASVEDYPQLHGILTREIMNVYADRLIRRHERSLELIQALQISTTWYSKDASFYQHIHMAATMGIELGMSTRTKTNKERLLELWKDDPRAKSELALKNTIDSKRAWLGCYFLCANAAMGTRRQNLIRWTQYMTECLHDLETSTEALPSDKSFCQWIKLQRLADDLGAQISTDDVSHAEISDPKIQYALKGFEVQMNEWTKQNLTDIACPTLPLGFHVVNLYMHEFAMPLDHGLENIKASQPNGSSKNSTQREPFPPAHVGALTTCLTSIHGMFDTFLGFDALNVRTLPVFHFARLARASVLLIRMHFASATSDSALGNVISSDDMKVEHYLSGLIGLLHTAASDDKCYPAHQLRILLVLLQASFKRSREGKTGLADEISVTPMKYDAQPVDMENYGSRQEYRKMQLEGDNSVHRSPPKDQKISPQPPPALVPAPAPAPTPTPTPMGDGALHMLSDVAMGNSAPNGQVHHPNGVESGWYGGYGTNGTHHVGAAPAYTMENYYPRSMTGVDTAYHIGLQGMHAGFEQAIGMTLEEGDPGSIMDDDGFYHIMQAAPWFFNGMGGMG